MFYISRIYDKTTTVTASSLFSTGTTVEYKVSKDSIITPVDGLDSIMCEVFDTKDGVCEWYFVVDIIKLVYLSNIKISTVNCSFYTNEVRKGLTSDNIQNAIKSLSICSSIYTADKSFITSISKGKMLGLKVNEYGFLENINQSLVADGVLTLPNFVKSLHLATIDGVLSFNKLVIESDDFNMKYSCNSLIKISRYCNYDLCIIVPNFRFYSNFLATGCNLYCKSEFNSNNISTFKKEVLRGLYKYYEHANKTRFIANDKWIYEYRLSDRTFNKRVNNNEIVF